MELLGRYSKHAALPDIVATGSRPRRASGASPSPRVHNIVKRLGPAIVAQIVAEYEAGASSNALTIKFGIGKGTVLKILDDHFVARQATTQATNRGSKAFRL